MKEIYSKPRLCVERFTLSQSIASDCNGNGTVKVTPQYAEKTTCGVTIGEATQIYWTNNSNCTFILGPNDTILGFCYDNPNGGYTIFGS